MSHLFCQNCGAKIEYAHAKPNFCAGCGQQLNTSIASVTTSPQKNTIVESVDFGEEETSSESVPNIGKIQVEFSAEANNTFTLGSLAGEKAPPNFSKARRSKSVNEFLDEKGRG